MFLLKERLGISNFRLIVGMQIKKTDGIGTTNTNEDNNVYNYKILQIYYQTIFLNRLE